MDARLTAPSGTRSTKLKLVISRRQADVKGMLGGHKGVDFSLVYRLELTREEQELVEKYKLGGYPLTWKNVAQGGRVPDDTIANMVVGRGQTLSDVTTLIKNEEIIKNACDALPTLFSVVRTFGGDEVIEYPRDRAGL
jgi:hypothetical protein